MTTYLVERYLPGRDRAWLEEALARIPRDDADVSYLGSLYVPSDESCFCRFERPRRGQRRAHERAGRSAVRADRGRHRARSAVQVRGGEMKKLLVLAAALVAAAGISVAIATASSPRSGELHVTKECSRVQRRAPARRLLHDHVLEPEGDQGRLEGHLFPGSDRRHLRERPRSRRQARRLCARPCRARSDRFGSAHALGRDRGLQLVPCEGEGLDQGRPQLRLGREVQLRSRRLRRYGPARRRGRRAGLAHAAVAADQLRSSSCRASSSGSVSLSSSGMIRFASTLPSSTPHWSNESIPHTVPCVKTLCS